MFFSKLLRGNIPNDIMTRENLTRFQDTNFEAMARFGLERVNRWIEKTITETKATNEQMIKENAQLAKDKRLLVEYNAALEESVSEIVEEY